MPENNDEKRKPFQLVKYFTLTSLTVMFLGSLILAILNIHWTRSLHLKKSEEYAALLVENLNHQIFLQFVIPIALKYGKVQLRREDQAERMDKIVRNTLHTFNVDMVNIYDLDNTISYSFDKDLIGQKDLGGSAYQTAMKGKQVSRLEQRGNYWQIWLGLPDKMFMVTFAPLRAEKPLSTLSGPVLGVIEIVQDLSQDYHNVFKVQVLVLITVATVMSLLFFVLLLVVKRGEAIMRRRNQERMKLEEKLNRAKQLSSLGEMTAGISHEIRNPLGIIKSSAELLKKRMSRLDPKNKIPEIILEEAVRLNNIITDFLNFARPRKPNRLPCDLTGILEKNITFLTPQIAQQHHIIKRYYSDNLPAVQADADMLYQAFLNILLNAMQAMPGGGELQIEMMAKGEFIRIRFEDEGEGIDDALVEKIWNPFFTTKEMGTGLGLGIVKNIIESHGGRIKISSLKPIRGTRVSVYLPIEAHSDQSDK